MKRWVLNGIRLVDKCKRDNIGAYAAQTAFFLMISLVPLAMFFITLIQYTPISEAMLLKWINQYLPAYVVPVLVTVLDEVYSKSAGILSTTALVAIWSASKGVHYLSTGLDEVNEIQEKPAWLILRLKAVFYTFVILLALVALLVLIVFGKSLEEVLLTYFPVIGNVASAILDFRILIVIPIMVLFFMSVYYSLPTREGGKHRQGRFRVQFPGAVLCTVAWYLLSIGISIYVGYFNGFSMYGSLTTIILMMLWIYFCMYILLFCAELNIFFHDDTERFFKKRKKMR